MIHCSLTTNGKRVHAGGSSPTEAIKKDLVQRVLPNFYNFMRRNVSCFNIIPEWHFRLDNKHVEQFSFLYTIVSILTYQI